jgi:folate-binding protein YgfZ
MTNEATGSQTATELRRPPLAEMYERAGAALGEWDGCVVPLNFGDTRAEYEAVRGGEGAGLFDLSARGRVEVSGTEAVQFLNGMLTNDVAKLEGGAWMAAAFPNPQGRLLASARVARLADSFHIDTEPATYKAVLAALERFTLAGDFRVRDLTNETACLSVQGARARACVAEVVGDAAAATPKRRAALAEFGGQPLIVIRATHTSEDGFDLFVPSAAARALWDALAAAAGARPAGFAALEVLRVEAGVPRFGVDADSANVVTEVVDEDEAVSYTKGCYVGQEIIARIHWRGHVAKRLAGLVFDREAEPPADARVRDCDGSREVGRITSTVFSPRLRRQLALAVVRHDSLAPGTELRVFSGEVEFCAAHVAALPFVRGTWYAGEDAGR